MAAAPPGPAVAEAPAPGAVDRALCRSALWEALALGFRAPDAETLARLASREGAEALADAMAVVDGTDGELVRAILAVGSAPPLTGGDLAQAYGRLFGHTARGLVPPYETEYGEDSAWEPQREMSDLAAFYRAFGFTLRPDAHERQDHLACECEFMLVLARKEAHALEREDGDMLAQTRRASRLFLRDHLGRWAPAFGRKLAREDAGGFYGALGALCAAAVAAECARAEVPAGPEFLRLRSTEAVPVPMACGTSEPGLE